MIRSLWTASSGMSAQKTNMDVIADNLANVNTSGYKKARADFEDLLYQNLKSPGADTSSGGQIPTGIQIGMGTSLAATQRVYTQGDPTQSGSQFDLMIAGKGFFKILSNGEEVYTRAGSFKVDSEGYLCDSNANRLQPEFSVPTTAVTFTVDEGGNMVAMEADGSTVAASGQLTIYNFINPAGLQAIGGNKFTPTAASGDPIEGNPGEDGLGTIAQGFLEMSNVDVVEEMVNMIATQRAYEISSKSIKAADEMMQMANNIKR